MKGDINANMIILAREARGMNQGELATKLAMSPTYLSKIEREELPVSQTTLDKIAEITKYPLSFFFQAGGIAPENVIYRKREKVPQKILTRINARVNVARYHVECVVNSLNIPLPSVPSLTVTDEVTPANIAQRVRGLWNVTNPIIDNIIALVESHGIVVMQVEFGTDRVDSRTVLTDGKYPVIFLNKAMLGDRQRYSLAYQLGHLIMHTYNPVDPKRDIGHDANEFAAEFLLPEIEMRQEFQDGVTLAVLAELKRKWKVSMIALLYRADNLGFLTENQMRYLIQQFNDKKIRRREPVELDVPVEHPKLLRQWLSELKNKKKLNEAGLAAELHLLTDEFIGLYSYL